MGKKSSKTKTEVKLPAWAQNLATGAGNQILGTVSGNQGNLNAIAGGIRGALPQLQSMALGTQPVQSGIDYANDVLGGKYLNSNPYMDDIVHQGEQDAANAVNSAFSMAGRTGGGAHQESLARGVAQAGNTVRYGNYAQERNNQQQAAGMLPAMNAAQYTGISPWLAAAQSAAGLPYTGIGNLGAIGGLYGGSGTTTGTQPGGWGTALLSAGAQALPFIFSDRRLKRDIKLIRRARDGLGVWEFSYNFDPTRTIYEGVMADEVKELRPEALGPERSGYMTVNYAALGSLA